MAKPIELNGIEKFDPHVNPTQLGQAWERWHRAFELFAIGKGIDDPAQKRALLLHHAGLETQDIFFTLTEEGVEDDNTYVKCVKTLKKHFSPKVNVPYERYEFRNIRQEQNETIEQYIIRLRRKVVHCQFEKPDEAIRDQIIEKCSSSKLRVKLLERGGDLTLDELRTIASTMELSDMQNKNMSHLTAAEPSVNKVTSKPRQYKGQRSKTSSSVNNNAKCFRCGSAGHFAKDPSCPARTKRCHKCKNMGHFQKCCKTKATGRVHQVNSDKSDNEDKLYAFNIKADKLSKHGILIDQIPVKVVIDSGSTANIIDKETWEFLKSKKVSCYSSQKTTKKLFAYGSSKPLELLGEFEVDVTLYDKTKRVPRVTFYVINEKAPALLSRKTAADLGILKLEPVYSVNDQLLNDYRDCFENLGKLKDYQLKLHIDEKIEPVAQKMYPIPFSLRQKVSEKLDELESMDVIEKAEGPTPWVSPVVVVPKPSGDIRICVDMRQANRAILRERQPIPTVDDVLFKMNNSVMFSKIDLNMGFHQIELAEESRPITTFITHKGLYRYKRLSFGINAAPEKFQHIISQVLQSCEGVANIADDIIVHGVDQDDHDKKLKKCLDTLKTKGLTVNLDKSQFNMDKVTFMGHVVSEKGIGPTEERVKDLLNAREPKDASEVRSFLGLVNFSARYIPDLATVTEPLRKLTRKNQPFNWGTEQKRAFKELKKRMSNVETLGYFKPGEKTKLFTDASNVGLGAVLLQESEGKDRVISYASRTLTEVEKRYSTTEKEALAIVWACERYHIYLYGTQFELITDHKPLEVIYSAKSQPSARIQRWVLRLLPYSFVVKYRPGSVNLADFMSRMTVKDGQLIHTAEEEEEYIRFVATNATPSAITTQQVERMSAEDKEFEVLHEAIKTDKWENIPEYMPMRYELSTIGRLVLRGTRIVIPKGLRTKCIQLAHEGHLGIVGTKQNLRTKVWWPKMDRDVEQFVKTCHGCQLVSAPPRPEPLKPTDLPAGPWQELGIDLMGPLPSGDFVFVVVDYYSRYFEIDVMKTVTSERVIDSLEKMFVTHGLPLTITSDNGRQFVSEMFEKYLNDNGIYHRLVTPLHPSANGEVERQNRTLLKRIRIAQAEGKEWKQEIRKFLMAYRTTPHATTGATPSELMFGRKIRNKLPDIQFELNDGEVRDRDMYMKEKNRVYTDSRRRAEESNLKIGDKVLLKQDRVDKLTTTFAAQPYTLVDKIGNQVTVQSPEGHCKVRNSTHVKRFHEAPKPVNDPEPVEASTTRAEQLQPNVLNQPEQLQDTMLNQPEQLQDTMVNQPEQLHELDPPLRRSARASRFPSKFKDFDLS